MTLTYQYDAALESLIDRAGRDRVFSLMASQGWGRGGAPKWVWRVAAAKVMESAQATE